MPEFYTRAFLLQPHHYASTTNNNIQPFYFYKRLRSGSTVRDKGYYTRKLAQIAAI